MPADAYQRFAITVPTGMATLIDKTCKVEGRNRSEFFREAVRHYMTTKFGASATQMVMPTAQEDAQEQALGDDPFRLFVEWGSEADAAYDQLA
jgi:hypothetical protein